MKNVVGMWLWIVVVSFGFAGGSHYSGGWIDMYSPSGDFIYNGLSDQREEKGFLGSKAQRSWTSNVQVFDLKSEETYLLFERNLSPGKSIRSVEFPPKLDEESRFDLFDIDGHFKNLSPDDEYIAKVFVTVGSDTGEREIYVGDESGRNLELLATVAKSERWELDRKYRKLRVFRDLGTRYEMKTYDW
ncbi:MAG: hypothetical protein AAGB46_10285 [Verrucomicrobiota bacterium]